jgi:hypothetical protein
VYRDFTDADALLDEVNQAFSEPDTPEQPGLFP